MLNLLRAGLRRLLTRWQVAGKARFLDHGDDLHVGRGVLLWAPGRIRIGHSVYIGKDVCIKANCEIGTPCLIANYLGIIGRHDHDFSVWRCLSDFRCGSARAQPTRLAEKAVVVDDLWIGYGAIVLTGTTISRRFDH